MKWIASNDFDTKESAPFGYDTLEVEYGLYKEHDIDTDNKLYWAGIHAMSNKLRR